MIDRKHEMKLQRCWRSFERAAETLDARDLLPEVLAEDVERIVFYSQVDRDTFARNILRRMRDDRQKQEPADVGTTE